MKTIQLPISLLRPAIMAAAVIIATNQGHAGWLQTAAGTYEYNNTANWTDGIIDDTFPSSLTIAGTQTITFNDNRLTLSAGLQVLATDTLGSTQLLTLRGTGSGSGINPTLTLAGDVTVNLPSGTRTVTIGSTTANQNLRVDLGGANRIFNISGSAFAQDTLQLLNTVSNGGIVKTGYGTLQLGGANTYTGSTVVKGGNINLINGSVLSSGSIVVSSTEGSAINGEDLARFNIDNNTGSANANRIGDATAVNLNTGALFLNNKNNSSNTEQTGAINLESGSSHIEVTRNGAASSTLLGASLNRTNQAVVRVTGTSLGTGGNNASIRFSDSSSITDAMIGGGSTTAGSTNISIVPWAVGGAAGTRFARATTGFVTYDATNGFRPLDLATEYRAGLLTAGSTTDNVRVTASETLTANTTINALLFDTTASAAQVIGGAALELTVTSGAIYGKFATAGSGGSHRIDVNTLNFAGNEAIIGNTGPSSSNSVFLINSAITNTGGKGLTKHGAGELILNGANTYTGNTVVNEGTLRSTGSKIPDASNLRVAHLGKFVVSDGAMEQLASIGGNGVIFLDNTSARINVGGSTGSAGRITVNSGGAISPGDPTGSFQAGRLTLGQATDATNLTLLAGADLYIDLYDETTFDSIALVNGSAILGGNLNIQTLNGFNPDAADTFVIMTTTGGISGAFDFVTSGYAADIIGNNLVLSVVPEPNTVSFLVGGMALLLVVRRSSRRGFCRSI